MDRTTLGPLNTSCHWICVVTAVHLKRTTTATKAMWNLSVALNHLLWEPEDQANLLWTHRMHLFESMTICLRRLAGGPTELLRYATGKFFSYQAVAQYRS